MCDLMFIEKLVFRLPEKRSCKYNSKEIRN